MIDRYDYNTLQMVNGLYGGGWRANDRDLLRHEYDLSDEDAGVICEMLADMEEME